MRAKAWHMRYVKPSSLVQKQKSRCIAFYCSGISWQFSAGITVSGFQRQLMLEFVVQTYISVN